ncbi:sigma-54-dependent transcriptional regulator [Chondromyces apiculatus]|uniref:NtrC n=1 Tax=Chondromyces apiculatus DSM 436 TaxID=1192034 RepID=A0A017TCF0_9BACT|nr:sigma 54-interacting transcriptional regulator [Chondromyces apiculatus]EYF06485.1 NtrC [Chondromyces apiculatus DSM 436]
MRPDEILTSLVPRLIAAQSFEAAARELLQAMVACVEAALEASPYARRGKLVSALVHFRPGDSYRRLFGIALPSGAPIETLGYLTSANVWHWLVEHRCSVSIDVQLATLRPWLRGEEVERRDLHAAESPLGQETRERMLGRAASHVHVVPLCTPAGGVDGMITLEASCKAAIGQEFVWGACHETLELLAIVAAPYLAALPLQQVQAAPTDEFLPVVGPSTAGLIEMLRIFAAQEETVLIGGPTGAGKSRLARWCHHQSPRREQPFETLDLLSVPEDLQMAELFGWKRGAFTGAVKDSAGAIARAARGTLFIDEIDKLSLKAQAGLLRVLEERRYRPLGDEQAERTADVRFIVGTNADLRGAVRAGRFREDLYYRINVLPVKLPPLSERLDELPLWAEYMLSRRHQEAGRTSAVRLTPDAVKRLQAWTWPGNLRQLDNIVRRAYALAASSAGGASGGEAARGDLVLEVRHVESALAYEGGAETTSLLAQLWRAANAFVQEVERREHSGAPLSFEHTEAFRGLVMGAAVQRRGDRDAAFVLLGQGHLLKNRNHHRTLKRELDRVRELMRSVGGEMDQDFSALLDTLGDPT